MNLTDMRTIVRRELRDEDSGSYRWTDGELDRHIARAVTELSGYIPLEQKESIATTAGSREVDISSITGRIMVEAVEYPAGQFPPRYQRFSLWGDILTLLGDEAPDGSDCSVYYGGLHTLDDNTSTIPAHLEDLAAAGACGHAAIEWAVHAVNRVNAGGVTAPGDFLEWGNQKLKYFRQELKRLGRKNRARVSALYQSYAPAGSKTRDYGPES